MCSTRLSSLIYWPIHLKNILIRKVARRMSAIFCFFCTIRFFFRWKSKKKTECQIFTFKYLSEIKISYKQKWRQQTLSASHSLISHNGPSVCNTNNNGDHFYVPKSAILLCQSLRGDYNSRIAAKDLKFTSQYVEKQI